MLIAMLVSWVEDGKPNYGGMKKEQTIAYVTVTVFTR
jgi:hypothetical protein